MTACTLERTRTLDLKQHFAKDAVRLHSFFPFFYPLLSLSLVGARLGFEQNRRLATALTTAPRLASSRPPPPPPTTDRTLAGMREDVVGSACPASARPPIAREDPGCLSPHTHTHTHTRTHTNTHTHTHTHTRTRTRTLHTHTTNPLHHHPNTPPPHLPLFGSRPKRREPSEAAALLTPARQAPRWSGELASVTPPVSALHVYCQAPRWGGSARARCRRSLRRGPTATSAAGRGGPQTRGGAGPRVPRFRRNRGFPRTPQGAWM